jgi:hypothetical protein
MSIAKRIEVAIAAAVVGGLGMIAGEAVDFYFWGIGWVEADTFVEDLTKAWYIPVGAAAVCGLWGLLRGERALDFAERFWHRWFW